MIWKLLKKKYQRTLSGLNQTQEIGFSLQGVHGMVKVHSGHELHTMYMMHRWELCVGE